MPSVSNLNCLPIELTFGYCFLSALHASWHSHPFRRHSGQQCGMTPSMNKAGGDWAVVPELRSPTSFLCPGDCWRAGRGWSVATLLEEQAIVMGHPQGTSNKENFLQLVRKPHSHILPWLRKASWHNYQLRRKLERGAGEQNPGEGN